MFSIEENEKDWNCNGTKNFALTKSEQLNSSDFIDVSEIQL